jgi:hypothetical protein
MSQPESVEISVLFQQWKKPSNTSAKFNTSKSIELPMAASAETPVEVPPRLPIYPSSSTGEHYGLQAAPTAYQVKDKHDYRNDDQDVDQPATDMEGKAKQPQNQKNYEDCPEHD